MSCTFCLCRTPDMAIAITPFSSIWAVLGIGRAAFFSQLSANSEHLINEQHYKPD